MVSVSCGVGIAEVEEVKACASAWQREQREQGHRAR